MAAAKNYTAQTHCAVVGGNALERAEYEAIMGWEWHIYCRHRNKMYRNTFDSIIFLHTFVADYF
jgi:hypothetical protein